jgi:hypothetical protein
MDCYVKPENRGQFINMLSRMKLRDIQAEYPYPPESIYRATNGDAIIEIIWAMQNQRAEVDDLWLERSEKISLDGLSIRVTSPEEIVWAKLYVINRQRCDWPDLLNLIFYCGHGMDWKHLLERLEEDTPLLAGSLSLLSWLAPAQLKEIPHWLLEELGIQVPAEDPGPEVLQWRARLLDSQEWFGARESTVTVLPQNNRPRFRERKAC